AAPAAYASAYAEMLPRLHEPIATPRPQPGAGTSAIDIGNSGLVSRAITGVSVPLRLEAAGYSLGTGRLIGGVDSTTADDAAVGGLAWHAGSLDGLNAGFDILRTGLTEAAAGGGLLTQTNLRVPLRFFSNAPSLGLSLGSYAGDTGQYGGAAR